MEKQNGVLKYRVEEFKNQPILVLELLQPGVERPKIQISFGQEKANSLSEVIDVVMEFAKTGQPCENARGCTFEEFRGAYTIVIPHDSLKRFAFQQPKAWLISMLAQNVMKFADTGEA